LQDDEIRDRRVLEVGSLDINGSLRSFVESRKPSVYIGIDIVEGPGVDIICDAENLLGKFEEESFDLVISTETLEHVRDWRKVISNIKKLCKPDGLILITTVRFGESFHACSYGFWRYEPEDMENIFSDCKIQSLETCSTNVFLKVGKPQTFREKDLSNYELYSIVAGCRIKQIEIEDYFRSWRNKKLIIKSKLWNTYRRWNEGVIKFLFKNGLR